MLVPCIKEYLCSIFTYDPTLPSCLRGKPSTRNKNGLPRGSLSDTCAYYRVHFKGKMVVAHKVVWMMHYGQIEDSHEIDHIDGDYFNNTLENLRSVTKSVNCRNRRRRSDNTTGVQGISVSINNSGNKYFTVQWSTTTGEIQTQRFSCTKLGESEALSMATAFQKSKRKTLLEEGYTERHINGD